MSTTTAKRPLATRAIDDQIRRAKSVLLELRETLEDLEDRRVIEKAKRRNGKKPCTPWHEVARESGITVPPRKSCVLRSTRVVEFVRHVAEFQP